MRWYSKAAGQGHADAQYNLGLCYRNGRGVQKDDADAVKWYRKAAEQGQADAQNNLGVCYQDGTGVTQSMAEAIQWYTKAAEQGYATTMCNLGDIYFKKPGWKDVRKAQIWYKRAMESSGVRNVSVYDRAVKGYTACRRSSGN